MTDRDTIGREPITILEIDQDRCSLTYGVAPCQAALGVTGDDKCYNTRITCQDDANFTLSTLTLRFCSPMEDTGLHKSIVLIPSLVSVDTVPTEINIGGTNRDAGPLGRRAMITAKLQDHPYHDRLVDPYASERDFDAMEQGTFWSKWLARNPYHQGRALRVREGYVGQTLAEMRVRNYIIERIEGPTKGIVSIIAKDVLKLIESERAQAPIPNTGVLNAAIDDNDLALVLSPAGIGNAEYPTSGTARIGSELVTYTRSGNNVTITARAVRGTEATSHEAGDIFQDCLVISSVAVAQVIHDLLVDYAGVPEAYIPLADWEEEADTWLSGFNLSTVITQPTGVDKLIAEINEQATTFIWSDDEDQEIKLRATRPFFPVLDAAPYEVTQEANIVAGSFVLERKPDERISEIQIYYDQINPTGSVDDPTNYARFRQLIDDDAETSEQYGEKRVKTIFARFMDSANDASTNVVAQRILDRQRDPPTVVKFKMDAKDSGLRPGEVARITHRDIVDFDGAADPTLFQIVASQEEKTGHLFQFTGRTYLFSTNYGFITTNDFPDYSSASQAQKDDGGFIAVDALGFANGDAPYRIL